MAVDRYAAYKRAQKERDKKKAEMDKKFKKSGISLKKGKGASSKQVAKALKSDDKTIKQKLQDWWKPGSSGVKTKKSSKLKITPAHDNPGAARAKAAALARKEAGLNTVTGKKKGVKKKRKITTWRDME